MVQEAGFFFSKEDERLTWVDDEAPNDVWLHLLERTRERGRRGLNLYPTNQADNSFHLDFEEILVKALWAE